MDSCGSDDAAKKPLDWKAVPVHGDPAVDIISAIEFDQSGDLLAGGYYGGSLVLFERMYMKNNPEERRDLERMDLAVNGNHEFHYKMEFQSHNKLESMNTDAEIKKIRWCPSVNGVLYLLSTNNKSIKLWKVTTNHEAGAATCQRIYSNAHNYDINSISTNSDGRTFISADAQRINLWSMEINNGTSNIIDMKAANMVDHTEFITSAEFCPNNGNMLAHGSSKGLIYLFDIRQSGPCDSYSKIFRSPEVSSSRFSLTDTISSISDIKFSRDGRCIVSRDYMSVKLWDINMNSGPIATFPVHDYIRPWLSQLHRSGSTFDKFECCISGDGLRVATGSYCNLFSIYGCSSGSVEATTFEANKNPVKKQVKALSRSISSMGLYRAKWHGDKKEDCFHFHRKILHMAWHPSENYLACGASNHLYVYKA